MITKNFFQLLARRTSPTFLLKHDQQTKRSIQMLHDRTAGYRMIVAIVDAQTPLNVRDGAFTDWWLPRTEIDV